MNSKACLPLLYCAPVQYYSKFFLYENVFIQAHENYNKQSYRNRCDIYGANGKQSLSIPIKKGRTPQLSYMDIEISYAENWQKNHIRAIESAYKHSPFFEFYWDEYLPLFLTKFETLWELNVAFHQVILRDLSLETDLKLSEEYQENGVDDCSFLAIAKGQKLADVQFRPKKYYQVFSDKSGFLENLSILDLIFNEGTYAYAILKDSIAV